MSKELVVPSHEFIEFVRHWFAIDGGHTAIGLQCFDVLNQPPLQTFHFFQDAGFNQIPLWFLSVPTKVRANRFSAVTNLCDAMLQFRVVEYFLDLAQPVGPAAKVDTCKRLIGFAVRHSIVGTVRLRRRTLLRSRVLQLQRTVRPWPVLLP